MSRRRWRNLAILPILGALLLTLLPGADPRPAWAAGNSSVSGTVFEDTNGDSARSRDEVVRPSVTVLLQGGGSGDQRRTSTNGSGAFEFTGLSAGTYVISIEPPDGFAAGTQAEVRLDGKNAARQVDLGLLKQSQPPAAPAAAPGPPVAAAPGPLAAAAPAQSAPRFPTLGAMRSAGFVLRGRSDDNGLGGDFGAEGHVLDSGDIEMQLSHSGQLLDVVVVGQKSYQRPASEAFWQPTSLASLRSRQGALSALDILRLPRLANQLRDVRVADQQQFEGRTVRYYELVLGSPPGTQSLPPNSEQLVVMDGTIQLWVSSDDGLIQLAHLQLSTPSNRTDLTGRVEPARLDATLRFSEQNIAFNIMPPPATALIQPTTPPAVAPAAAQPAGQVAGIVSRAPTAASMPTARTAQPAATEVPPATPAAEASLGRSAVAERALLSLASSSGPRGSSRTDQNGVVLAVPWRSQLVDPSGASLTTDGPASLGMILEAYGVVVGTADLEALAASWQEPWTPSQPVRLETLTRIAQRGSLRPLGPSYGTGGDEWTAAVARDYIKRGYPVLALVRPAFISSAAADPNQPDRYVVLMGFDEDALLYHDPSSPDGAARRVSPAELDLAWANAAPARQGVAPGFGTNLTGLLDPTARQASATAVATATAQPLPTLPVLATATSEAGVVIQRADVASGGGGMHPALLVFLAALMGGVGFVLARLLR
jgi:hypothetical protein